jgi:hypothetical protein
VPTYTRVNPQGTKHHKSPKTCYQQLYFCIDLFNFVVSVPQSYPSTTHHGVSIFSSSLKIFCSGIFLLKFPHRQSRMFSSGYSVNTTFPAPFVNAYNPGNPVPAPSSHTTSIHFLRMAPDFPTMSILPNPICSANTRAGLKI